MASIQMEEARILGIGTVSVGCSRMLRLQKVKQEKKQADQVLQRCSELYQRTNYDRLGLFWGLTVEAEGLAREDSVLPLCSAFVYKHHWRQDILLDRPECVS